jgi:hypothetical protein
MNLLASGPFISFIVLALLLQTGIAEQTVGAVGLLNAAGLNNDQLHPLFWLVTLAMIAGLVASALALKPARFSYLKIIGFLIIAVAAVLDSQVTNLTRPEQLYLSQALVGFAATFVLGPLFLFGLLQALPKGEAAFISFLAAYSITANLGSLGAVAAVGTYETFREKSHSHDLVEYVVPSNPQVATRLQESNGVYAAMTIDPTLQQAEGAALLTQKVTSESTVLAYIDVFQVIAGLAAITVLSLLGQTLWRRYRVSRTSSPVP